MSLPSKGDAPNLWSKAYDSLTDEEKEHLESHSRSSPPDISHVIQTVEEKQEDCEAKQWVLYTDDDGNEVKVRDKLSKICDWLKLFMTVGDTAVQYDPAHAALPWAAVRALLQITINDCQTFGAMVGSIETISGIVARCGTVEANILYRRSNLTQQLSVALFKLYRSSLKYLSRACKFYREKTIKEEILKLVTLVTNEVQGGQLDRIIKLIQESVASSHASNEDRQNRLATWINGIVTGKTYSTILKSRQEGTSDWALELSEFQAWASDESTGPRLLWMHGPPGFGKTFMSGWIIHHLKEKKQAPLAFFFCVADTQATRDPYAILRSWLTQMLGQDERILAAMMTIHRDQREEQSLTHAVLWNLFSAVVEAVENCTFIIDGFDECVGIDAGVGYHHDEPRNYFLRDLLKSLASTKSRVLVVSRDTADIRTYLGGNTPQNSARVTTTEYCITSKDTTGDVGLVADFMVDQKLENKPEKLRKNLSKQAAKKSDGMFLWIKLLEAKISPELNSKKLSEAVTEMPPDISKAYKSELDKIDTLYPDHKEQAIMVLRWTLFAIRPLQVKQLAEALIVSGEEDMSGYPEDDLPDTWHEDFVDKHYVRAVIGRCGSLLQLKAGSPDTPIAEHTVHFVHFSFEYLQGLSSSAGGSEWALKLGLGSDITEHTRLSNICLRYLTFETFHNFPLNTHSYPFLSYAAWAWYFHGFHKKPHPTKEVLNRTQKVFDPATPTWKIWTPLMEAELADSDADEGDGAQSGGLSTSIWSRLSRLSSDSSHNERASVPEVPNPLYYASLLGLIDVVQWLEEQDIDFNCVGGRYGFPLQAAVVANHEHLVRYFVNRRVDIRQEGGYFHASIIAAAAKASPSIVGLLLANKADVNVTDKVGWTALHHASKRGHVPIVHLLIDHGAEVDAAADDSTTPMVLAASYGYKEVLSALAEKGSSLSANSANAKDALRAAIDNGDNETLRTLLRLGISPNTILISGRSALNQAARFPSLVQSLLEYRVDPSLPDEYGLSPLGAASAFRNADSMRLLLKAGATGLGNPGHKALSKSELSVCIAKGFIEGVKMLVEHGESLDQVWEGGVTPLMLAIRVERTSLVMWLLDSGASMRGISEDYQSTLFDAAVQSFDSDLAQTLARRGCFQIKGSNGRRIPREIKVEDEDSLVMLAYKGDREKTDDFLRMEKETSSAELSEALLCASAKGHLHIVKSLLKRGAQVDSEDQNGRTALHYALKHFHVDVADHLVECGASVFIEDMVGATPIDLAVRHGQKAARFIHDHMDGFALSTSRRPSLLTANSSEPGGLTPRAVRAAISGSWDGHYEYIAFRRGKDEPFAIQIRREPSQGLDSSSFSNSGTDLVGPFQFHGFVDSIGTVWFVKLYARHGWLYRGTLNPERTTLKGTWGTSRQLWKGKFYLTKISD